MRTIEVSQVKDTVKELCIKANVYLPKSLEDKIKKSIDEEKSPVGKNVFPTYMIIFNLLKMNI